MERRREIREAVSRSARIIFEDGATADCTIANISPSGAKLLLPSSYGATLPRGFELEDSSGGRRPAVIVWQSSWQVGVRFTDAPGETPAGFGKRGLKTA